LSIISRRQVAACHAARDKAEHGGYI